MIHVTNSLQGRMACFKIILRSYWYIILLYFSQTLLPLAPSGYTIGRMSFIQLLTNCHRIPISLYHFDTSSSQGFHGLPLVVFLIVSIGWITSALLWGAVGSILLTCDHHLMLLLAVCSVGCLLNYRLFYSFLILSTLF